MAIDYGPIILPKRKDLPKIIKALLKSGWVKVS